MNLNMGTFGRHTISERYASASSLIWLAGIMTAAFILLTGIAQFDSQQFNGVNAWGKPAKFAFSLGIHALTLAWGVQFMTNEVRASRSIRRASIIFSVATLFEVSWISYQASRGEASHFNMADPIANMMYAVMGIGAVSLTAVTVFFGWKIIRSGNSVMHAATGYGFIVSGLLTTIVAGYMSSQGAHNLGGDISDASGLGLFHWSTSGGDFRVSHFAALHIAQGLPLLGWLSANKRVVAIGAAGAIFVTGALFAQAWVGIPFLAR